MALSIFLGKWKIFMSFTFQASKIQNQLKHTVYTTFQLELLISLRQWHYWDQLLSRIKFVHSPFVHGIKISSLIVPLAFSLSSSIILQTWVLNWYFQVLLCTLYTNEHLFKLSGFKMVAMHFFNATIRLKWKFSSWEFHAMTALIRRFCKAGQPISSSNEKIQLEVHMLNTQWYYAAKIE